MDVIHLWQWRYTDQFGKRRIFPCLLSEENGRKLQDAERVRRLARGAPGQRRAHDQLSAPAAHLSLPDLKAMPRVRQAERRTEEVGLRLAVSALRQVPGMWIYHRAREATRRSREAVGTKRRSPASRKSGSGSYRTMARILVAVPARRSERNWGPSPVLFSRSRARKRFVHVYPPLARVTSWPTPPQVQ